MSDAQHFLVQGPASKAHVCGLIRELSPERQWIVEVEEYHEKRSLAQNRTLWGVVYKQIVDHIFESTGQRFMDTEVHAKMKDLFLISGVKRVKVGRRRWTVKRYKSTAKLGRKAFNEYIERIAEYCASDLGLKLQMPEDRYAELVKDMP